MDTAQILSFITNHFLLVSILFVAVIALAVLELRNTAKLSVNPQQLVTCINHKQAILWDLRSKKDFDLGHITSARNISTSDIAPELKKLQERAHRKQPMQTSQKVLKQQNTSHTKEHNTKKQAGARKKNTDVPVVLICSNGAQSGHQIKKLTKLYPHLSYLQGGIIEWQQQKLPLIKS